MIMLAARLRAVLLSVSVCALVLLALASGRRPGPRTMAASAFRDGPTASWTVREGVKDASGVAWASFEDGLLDNGWGVLNVRSNADFEDEDQAYAAGLLEGFLTAAAIHSTASNLAAETFSDSGGRMPAKLKAFMSAQEAWTRKSVTTEAPTDAFFQHVGYLMRQYDGLVDGYALRQAQPSSGLPALESWHFQLLNGVGDIFDIKPAVEPSGRVPWAAMGRRDAEAAHAEAGHCSAIVTVAADMSDIFFGHSSWFTFSNTNRIFKHYYLDFRSPTAPTAARGVSFSSYPGFLESLDDFYLLSSGLAWMQTTNAVLDASVYDAVTPKSLLAWQRVRVASAMASSGEEWARLFGRNASGTYANQYMVLDLNRFRPREPLQPGLLWVVEEMPGIVVAADKTDVLRSGYWASYNVPYFNATYVRSGYPAMAKRLGNYWTHDLAPRAQIFRRDHGGVKDLASLKRLLRSNDFLDDPLSFDGYTQNPLWAICSRGDLALNASKASIHGCYDTKVASYQYGRLKAQIINGPTRGTKGVLPPFAWADKPAFAEHAHAGLPLAYDFSFIHTEPLALPDNIPQVQSTELT